MLDVFHSKSATDSLIASRSRYSQSTIRLIRNRGQDGWLLAFGKLDFGRKAAKLRIRRGSSAVSFQLSCSSSLAAPDLTLSTFRLRQTPAALTSIGLKPSCREATDTRAVLKSLTQAREQPSSKPPCFKHARLPIDMPPFRFPFAPADHGVVGADADNLHLDFAVLLLPSVAKFFGRSTGNRIDLPVALEPAGPSLPCLCRPPSQLRAPRPSCSPEAMVSAGRLRSRRRWQDWPCPCRPAPANVSAPGALARLATEITARPHPVDLRCVAVCRLVLPNPSGPKSDFALQPRELKP